MATVLRRSPLIQNLYEVMAANQQLEALQSPLFATKLKAVKPMRLKES